MRRVVAFYRTTVGKKVLVAVTGFILLGFVIVHMIGNLKAFQGADYFDHYAEALRALGAPFFGHGQALWLFRIVLLIAVGLHAWLGIELDGAANRDGGPRISTPSSPVAVWVIPTNEELMIARHTLQAVRAR